MVKLRHVDRLRLVLLSDTHGRHDDLDVPDGDILVHAGDFTKSGTEREVASFGAFLKRMPHAAKCIVAGNHDFLFERQPERAREYLGDVHYLFDSGASVHGLEVWGSPWQPWFHDWAFNLPRGPKLAERWAMVPSGLDLLITHSPPAGVLDRTFRGERVGCEDLSAALERIAPKLHVFGHIHEDRGAHIGPDGRLSLNACNLNLRYQPVHAPMVVDWGPNGPVLVQGGTAD